MLDEGGAVAQLQSLGLPRQWKGVAPKSMRALDLEVVWTALERMHATSSPAVVYQRLLVVFAEFWRQMRRSASTCGIPSFFF